MPQIQEFGGAVATAFALFGSVIVVALLARLASLGVRAHATRRRAAAQERRDESLRVSLMAHGFTDAEATQAICDESDQGPSRPSPRQSE